MSNIIAMKPPVEGTPAKSAQPGTLMFRRADVLGALRKLTFYARRNVDSARDEGRHGDADVQMARLRAFDLVFDALACCPVFDNPQMVMERARDSDRSAEGGETGTGSPVGESAGPKDIAQTSEVNND